MILETAIQLPPEIIDGILALGSAILGWLARWLSTRSRDKKRDEENVKLKTVLLEYDQAAREAFRTARKPKPPQD